jgi:hypothetical protein
MATDDETQRMDETLSLRGDHTVWGDDCHHGGLPKGSPRDVPARPRNIPQGKPKPPT